MVQNRSVKVSVVHADVTSFCADVLALKFAQDLYGADQAVFSRLTASQQATPMPAVGEHVIHRTEANLGVGSVIFLGMPPLRSFGYSHIREFAMSALETISDEQPDARHIALTIHGPGVGLDEIEAFESALAGVVDAVLSPGFSSSVTQVTFVERNRGRAKRLSAALERLLPGTEIPAAGVGGVSLLNAAARETLRSVGYASSSKPRAFVAMPFAAEMDDTFHYGIQGATNSAGLLCERADLSSFTGDVMEWVKERISTARLLIADLSTANANVYLEVGYAWGKGVPTLLLCKNKETDLKFNVAGHRCIVYRSIKHLEETLAHELTSLLQAAR